MDSVLKVVSTLDNNRYVSLGLLAFLVVYAALVAPRLPAYAASVFDNPLFRVLVFFLIAYSAQTNPTAAILAAVGVLISMQRLNRIKADAAMAGAVEGMDSTAASVDTPKPVVAAVSPATEGEVAEVPAAVPSGAEDGADQYPETEGSEESCPSMTDSAGWPQYTSNPANSFERENAAAPVVGFNVTETQFGSV